MNGDRDRKALSGVTGSLFRHLRMMNGGAPVERLVLVNLLVLIEEVEGCPDPYQRCDAKPRQWLLIGRLHER